MTDSRPKELVNTLFTLLGNRKSAIGARSFVNGRRAPSDPESGTSAIELALSMIILITLLMGSMQFGAVFFIQNQMTSVASDVARRVAIGEIDQATGKALAHQRMIDWGVTYNVTVELPDPSDPNDKDVEVRISAPMAQAAIIDFPVPFGNAEIAALAVQRDEQL